MRVIESKLNFILPKNTLITSNNCKLGECVRWGRGGGWEVGASGKGVQNLLGL